MRRSLPALTLATALAATTAWAQPFPSGKPVSIHVGADAGGANDLVMRLVARHIGKYLPGRPTVIPRNTPGAGGKRLATFLYNSAARDGTELGVIPRSVLVDQLLPDPSSPFQMHEMTWIGTPTSTTDTCIVWHKARVQSLADLQTHELVIAGTGNELTLVTILQRLTGGKVRVVAGYPGGGAMNIALERGEADGRCGISWEALKTNNAEWLRERKVKVLIQNARTRNPELPDVPLVTDLAQTAIDRAALAILQVPQAFGFPFLAPPALMPEVALMLRNAFAQTMSDPQVTEEAARIRIELRPTRGEELQRLILEAHAASPETVARARALIAPN